MRKSQDTENPQKLVIFVQANPTSKKEKSIDIKEIRPLKWDFNSIGRSIYLTINVTAWIIYYINIYIL